MTKATSKAETRRRKGQRSAAATISLATCDGHRSPLPRPKDQTLTVRAQRLKQGTPAALVADPLSGHELGKLRLAGEITIDQYDAGIRYQEVRSAFLCKIIGMAGTIQAQDVNRIGGSSGVEENQEKIAALRAMHLPMMNALHRAAGPTMWTFMDSVIIRNEATKHIARLSIGLRALAVWKDGR